MVGLVAGEVLAHDGVNYAVKANLKRLYKPVLNSMGLSVSFLPYLREYQRTIVVR